MLITNRNGSQADAAVGDPFEWPVMKGIEPRFKDALLSI